jgi:hypothetical protein
LIKAGNGHTFQRRVLFFIGVQFLLAGALKMCIGSLFMMQPPRNRFPCGDTPCTEEQYCATDYDYEPVEQFGSITRDYDLVC